LSALASGPFKILAGGTDYYPALRDRPASEDTLDLTRIAELRGITTTADGWRIGATTTWTDIVRARLPACFDGLQAAAREVGSVQIQNAGTIAGNFCNASPAADGVPPLLTLDAEVEIASVNGRRLLPLSAFITGVRRTALQPDEIVTAVLIPHQQAHSDFLKLGARKYLVISIAMVAAALEIDDGGRIVKARVAVGACSPVACRLAALEADLVGATAADLTAIVGPSHLAGLSPIDDVRADGGYRLQAVEELVRRVLVTAAAGPRREQAS